jgi:hypothetical protein
MQQFFSSDQVRLRRGLDGLHLYAGEVGVICRSWHYPTIAYEVEFQKSGQSVRVLLMNHHIEQKCSELISISG